ncbi:MAG: thioredoxin domain-containing protein, partial [Isosphaeraceae bacterium]
MQHLTPARFSNGRRAATATWLLITLAGLLASDIPSIAQEPAGGNHRPANRLAKETSPYLLLHAHNPVDWYPWGPEAFARAKAEKKPIFLSIGYSSCYWCHVMERESFMDPEIARFLNEHFVSIKVDREERPDVDQVYMAALQAFSTGGWPMSMFLLPDGRPFYGETYLPPRDRQGISGFLTVLSGIDKAWREERGEIERAAAGLTEIVRRKLGSSGSRRKPALTLAFAAAGRAALAEQFDPEFGGF